MKTEATIARTSCAKTMAGRLSAACVARLLPLWLWTLPAVVEAQFNYTTNNGTLTITAYNGPGGAVTIPGVIDGLPVTSIGGLAFSYWSSLTSITIPNSVTSIGSYAFWWCYGLTNVAIPGSVTNLGNGAFDECSGLSSVTIGKSVASIGNYAFADCTGLNGLYFQGNAPGPGSGSHLFNGDSNATVYYLPGTTGWGGAFGGLPAVLWNPQVQSERPGFGVLANRFGFTITGTSNIVVVVEACTNLGTPSWSQIQTITLTGGSFYFSDPRWTNYPSRYYRLGPP